MKVGITGADGFLGFHVRAFLHGDRKRFDVRLANRRTFLSAQRLDEFVDGLDAIIHCAGMNRGDESRNGGHQPRPRRSTVGALQRTRAVPTVVFANSTHVDRDSAYGRGKRAAAKVLSAWGRATGAPVHDVILPHVFGEFGRPFYNSVVATFCHLLARKDAPTIDRDGDLELIHAQDVAEHFMAFIAAPSPAEVEGIHRVAGTPLTVSDLLSRLQQMCERYDGDIFPDVSDHIDLCLFNTLRSFMFPARYPRSLRLNTDNRGALFEAVKSDQGGQTFLSWTHPGITRGNHYHRRKVERFLVLSGQADIRLRRLFSDQIVTFRVVGATPAYIDMPTFHTHNITNVGDGELQTFFWANEIFDPDNPDTYPEAVEP